MLGSDKLLPQVLNGLHPYYRKPQEPAKQPQRGHWRVSITTYHQVGDDTSPRGWKWLAYIEEGFTGTLDRDPADFPLGLIWETWNSERS